MPGKVHSMELEHVLRDFQTDRGSLFMDASFGGSSTPSGNRRNQLGRDRRDRARHSRGDGITRNPAMIVAAKPQCDPVVRVWFRLTSLFTLPSAKVGFPPLADLRPR